MLKKELSDVNIFLNFSKLGFDDFNNLLSVGFYDLLF